MTSKNMPVSAKNGDFKVVLLMALGFGLVGIDRFLISTMFPVIAEDLKLDYGDIGIITGALAIAWGIAALIMGNLADRMGRRIVLVGSLLVFSLLIGVSGLAVGLLSLVAVRIMMGFADGAFTPASISATLEASPSERRGRNIGIQQMTLTLFGLGLAPILVGALLHIVDWRWVFAIFTIPGLILVYFTQRYIPEKAQASDSDEIDHEAAAHGHSLGNSSLDDWRKVLSYSNVRILMVLMLCWLTCLITTSAFMPSYLLDYLHLEFDQMVTVMTAIGFGSAAGTLLLPWLSDHLGRKPVMLIATFGCVVSLLLLGSQGASVPTLFTFLFMVHFFNNALLTLTVGPVCAETVPVKLMATASGVVIAAGEFFGGGIAPIIVGTVADIYGIEYMLWLPIAVLIIAFLLCTRLKETKPNAHLFSTEKNKLGDSL